MLERAAAVVQEEDGAPFAHGMGLFAFADASAFPGAVVTAACGARETSPGGTVLGSSIAVGSVHNTVM